MKSSPKKFLRTVMLNVSWSLIGKLVNMVSTFVMGIFIARYLGPEKFGILKYVVAYVSLFTIFARFGTDHIIVRQLSRKNEEESVILGSAFSFRMLSSLFVISFIILFTYFTELSRDTFWLIVLFSSSVIVVPLDVVRLYFKSRLKNEIILVCEVIRSILSVSLKIYFILFEFSLFWFIVINVFDFVSTALFSFLFYKFLYKSKCKWIPNKKYIKYFIYESFPLLLAGISALLSQQVDQIMLKKYIGSESVAQYAVAVSFLSIILFLPQIIVYTVAPVLIKLKEKSEQLFLQKVQLFSDIVIWGTFFMAIIVSVSSTSIIPLIYGNEYKSAGEVLQILAWKTVFVANGITTGQIIIIYGIQKSLIIRDSIGAVINISLNFLLIPMFAEIGAAWTTIISYSIGVYLIHYIIKPLRPILSIQNKTFLFGLQNIYVKVFLKYLDKK